jgi:hypothetical protein
MASSKSRSVLRGQAEVIAAMRKLEGAFEPVLDEVGPASEPIRTAATANAPRDADGDGEFATLSESIISEERKRTRSFIEQRVGPSEAAPHGLWNEGGHKVLRTSGGRVLGTVPPNPFLGPAYRQHRNKVRKALRDRFKSLIDGFRP